MREVFTSILEKVKFNSKCHDLCDTIIFFFLHAVVTFNYDLNINFIP